MSRKLVEENAELEHGSRVTPTIAIKHAVRDRDSLNNPTILGCVSFLSARLQIQLTGNRPWKPRHLVYNAECAFSRSWAPLARTQRSGISNQRDENFENGGRKMLCFEMSTDASEQPQKGRADPTSSTLMCLSPTSHSSLSLPGSPQSYPSHFLRPPLSDRPQRSRSRELVPYKLIVFFLVFHQKYFSFSPSPGREAPNCGQSSQEDWIFVLVQKAVMPKKKHIAARNLKIVDQVHHSNQ